MILFTYHLYILLASVSSGGLAIGNFLYTLEGFQVIHNDHLTDRDKIVTVRWLVDAPRFAGN